MNVIFNEIGAKCVISKASMPSKNILMLSLEVYFYQDCITCYSSRIKLIKQPMPKGISILVIVEYHEDCNYPIDLGSIFMTLETDTSSFNDVSLPTQSNFNRNNKIKSLVFLLVSIQSLVHYTNPCPSNQTTTTTIRPTSKIYLAMINK